MAALLEGPAGSNVEIGWRGADKRYRTATLPRRWRERDFGIQINHRGHTAVVVIDAFTRNIANDFASAFSHKLRKLNGLVIDLRNNGGGDAGAMVEVAATLMQPATRLGLFKDRFGNIALALDTQPRLSTRDSAAGTRIPIVILTSERTSSAAEIFVDSLRRSRRAWSIGTETCGCVLAIRSRHSLPDGGQLDVSELDYQTVDGQRLEGAGLMPDESVSATRRDLYAGKDRALDVALSRLKESTFRDQRSQPDSRAPQRVMINP